MSELFQEFPWLPVLLGGVGYFILGALWYSKLLFAKPWLAYTRIDPNNPDAKKGVAAIMLGSLVLMILTAFVQGILVQKIDGLHGLMSGVKLGLVTGTVGICAISISYVYEKRPFGLHLINGGYTLVGNIVSGIIICMMTG